MKCLNDEIILKYTNGLLPPDEKMDVMSHLADCGNCRSLLEAEKKFDLALKKGLSEDYRFARLSELILERAYRENQGAEKSPLKWFAITGGLISALAIFNSFALIGLVLYLNDFSIAKIIINTNLVASSILRYFSIYGIWLSIVSATMYTAVAIFAFTLFFARKTILKTVKI